MEKTKSLASDSLLMEQLDVVDWQDLWPSLLARCMFLANSRYGLEWSKEEKRSFSRKIVSETIEKVFVSKSRKWNVAAYSDFDDFITSAVDSHFNNTLNKTDKEVLTDNDFILDQNGGRVQSTEDLLSAQEQRELVIDELKIGGANDDELLVFECMADGVHKPAEIREDLGITKTDFHNIFRKLKRKLQPIRDKIVANGLK